MFAQGSLCKVESFYDHEQDGQPLLCKTGGPNPL